MKTTLLMIASVLAFTAKANVAENFNIDVSRINGSLDCTMNDGQTDHAAFDCTLKVAGAKKVTIVMKPYAKADAKEEEVKAYIGQDHVINGKLFKGFNVVTDGTKAVRFVFFTDAEFGDTKNILASLSGAPSSQVGGVSLHPISVKSNEDNSEVKLFAAFTMYSQNTNVLAQAASGIIPEEMMSQVRMLMMMQSRR